MEHKSSPGDLAGPLSLRAGMLALLMLALVPSAHAYAGTALIWVGAFQLLFGNFLIGIVEGLVISRWFGVGRARAILIMIPANYFSCWISCAILAASGHGIRGDIMGVTPYAHMWLMVGLLFFGVYLLSLILEWPFCFWILAGQTKRLKRSWLASLAAQTSSCLILIPFFNFASYFGLTNISVDESLSFAPAKGSWIYYLSPLSGDVYRIRPDRSAEERVASAGEKDPRACLFAVQDAGAPQHTSLWVRAKGLGSAVRPVIGGLSGGRFGPLSTEDGISPEGYTKRKAFLDLSHTSDLRIQPASDWVVEATVRGVMSAANARLTRGAAFEFPGVNLVVSSAILLPGDQVLFQWGDNIMLLDLNTGKMGRVTPGRGPVAAVE